LAKEERKTDNMIWFFWEVGGWGVENVRA